MDLVWQLCLPLVRSSAAADIRGIAHCVGLRGPVTFHDPLRRGRLGSWTKSPFSGHDSVTARVCVLGQPKSRANCYWRLILGSR
jgi:hypothetical protein